MASRRNKNSSFNKPEESSTGTEDLIFGSLETFDKPSEDLPNHDDGEVLPAPAESEVKEAPPAREKRTWQRPGPLPKKKSPRNVPRFS